MKKLALFVIAFVALGAAPASAQISWSLGAGPSFDVGSDLPVGNGFNAQLGAEFGIPVVPVGLRVDGMINRLPIDPVDGNFQFLSGTANAVLKLPGIALVPYLTGGIGVYNVKVSVDGADDATDTYGGFNGGGGVRFGLGGLGVFAEARAHVISGADALLVPITFGVRF